jgi:hypothetical protein
MNKELSHAEAVDLMNSRIAIGLLMASLAYGLDACVYLLSGGDNQVFHWLSFSISMFVALWIFRAVAPELWNKFKRKNICHQEPESFITESFHKAIIKSWAFTIATLMVLTVLEQFIARLDLPFEFYIKGLVFIMLFSASVTFLVTNYTTQGD